MDKETTSIKDVSMVTESWSRAVLRKDEVNIAVFGIPLATILESCEDSTQLILQTFFETIYDKLFKKWVEEIKGSISSVFNSTTGTAAKVEFFCLHKIYNGNEDPRKPFPEKQIHLRFDLIPKGDKIKGLISLVTGPVYEQDTFFSFSTAPLEKGFILEKQIGKEGLDGVVSILEDYKEKLIKTY
jgi:hypothetical protein